MMYTMMMTWVVHLLAMKVPDVAIRMPCYADLVCGWICLVMHESLLDETMALTSIVAWIEA